MAAQPDLPLSLTLVRRFNATPEKVYAAWTRPAALARWMGPPGVIAVEAETDVRVGGAYRIRMQVPGDEHVVSGTYREVEPARRLAFTWAWASTPERESLVTIDFTADGAETVMTFTHAQFFDTAARDRHAAGWAHAFEHFVEFINREEHDDVY